MTAYPFSREISRRSGSNFYLSFFFLPAEKRNGLLSVYAFSRLVDDAVDEASSPEEAKRQMVIWRQRLDACYCEKDSEDREISHPLLAELQETIRGFKIPKAYFDDLLVGVEMDLTKKRYATFQELERYCYHVAGTVGLLCNHLFGLDEEGARRYALHLGTAFQLTNIIRDVGSDADRGRIYLPLEDLERFRVPESDFLEKKKTPAFLELMQFQSDRARVFFEKAFEALPDRERKKLVPAEIMSIFYQRILQRIQKENFPVFERKVALSKGEKLALMVKTVLRSLV